MTTIDLNLFFSAARNGNLYVLKKCLDYGIDIHCGDDLALRYAVENNQAKAVILLLNHGANIQAVNDATLRQASADGEIATVEMLLKNHSCSQEAKIYAMYNAILCEYAQIVSLLLQNGVSPTARDGAILKVLQLCENREIIALFKDYLE